MIEDTASSANLTFDDVVIALGDTDPNKTNSLKLRAILGRGGPGTIQKHLEKIRADRAAALLPSEDGKAPAMPDSVAAMWGAAYGTAMAVVRERMDAIVQERDALTTKLSAAGEDRQAWEAEVISTAAQLAGAEAKLANVESSLAEAAKTAEAVASAAAVDMAAVKALAESTASKLNAELADVKHALAMSELKAQNTAQALQVTIDNLTGQVGELKSVLHIATRADVKQQTGTGTA